MSGHGGVSILAGGGSDERTPIRVVVATHTIGGTNGTDRRSGNTGGGDSTGRVAMAIQEKTGARQPSLNPRHRPESLREEVTTRTDPRQAAQGQGGAVVRPDQVNGIVELEDGRIVEARIAKPGFHFDTNQEGRVLVFSDARSGDHIEPTEAFREGIIAIEVQR